MTASSQTGDNMKKIVLLALIGLLCAGCFAGQVSKTWLEGDIGSLVVALSDASLNHAGSGATVATASNTATLAVSGSYVLVIDGVYASETGAKTATLAGGVQPAATYRTYCVQENAAGTVSVNAGQSVKLSRLAAAPKRITGFVPIATLSVYSTNAFTPGTTTLDASGVKTAISVIRVLNSGPSGVQTLRP